MAAEGSLCMLCRRLREVAKASEAQKSCGSEGERRGAAGSVLLRVSHVLLLSMALEPDGPEMLLEDPTPVTTAGTFTLGTPGTTLLPLVLELPTLPLGALTPVPMPATAPTLVTGPMPPTAYEDVEEEEDDGPRLRTCASSSSVQTRSVNCGRGVRRGGATSETSEDQTLLPFESGVVGTPVTVRFREPCLKQKVSNVNSVSRMPSKLCIAGSGSLRDSKEEQ